MKLRTVSRILIAFVVTLCVGLAALAATTGRGSPSAPAYIGTPLADKPAPNVSLTDQNGRRVTLRGQRGHDVILTFFYARCPDTCPLTAEKLRTIFRNLGPEARRLRVMIISTDPVGDTPATTKAFLAKHGLKNWSWLMGSYSHLRKVWEAYHVYAPEPSTVKNGQPTHTAVLYLIDSQGRERELVDDILPAAQMEQDLHILLNDHRWTTGQVAPSVGSIAPGFSLASLGNHKLSLRQYRGKPVLLNFWATWCVPCKKELPLLEHSYARSHGKITVLGIDQQEPASEVRTFVKTAGVTYPIGLDLDGNVFYRYELTGTPTTFFIDRHGLIERIISGALNAGSLPREIQGVRAN